MRVGNRFNSWLNGEYAHHVRTKMKRYTSRMRRAYLKREEIKEKDEFSNTSKDTKG